MIESGPFSGPLPDKPVLVVSQSLIDRYGVADLKRVLFDTYHRDIEIVVSKPMPTVKTP